MWTAPDRPAAPPSRSAGGGLVRDSWAPQKGLPDTRPQPGSKGCHRVPSAPLGWGVGRVQRDWAVSAAASSARRGRALRCRLDLLIAPGTTYRRGSEEASTGVDRRDLDWTRLDASTWAVAGEEVQGRTPHFWFRHPQFERTWLFKPAFPDGVRPMGEDVTEMLASNIAHRLGVPAAQVRLAARGDSKGCLIEDLRWSNGADDPGRVLLDSNLPDYDPTDPGHRGYNPVNIMRVLDGFGPPPGSDFPPEFAAFDVFVGYLVLDALIANTDRHDRNWAV